MTPPRRERARPARRIFVALLLAAAATGCKSGPYTATLHFEGTSQLNPTFDGEPSALTLRIFALKDPEAFKNASDDDLMAEKPALAATAWMEPHKEETVYVGQAVDVPFEIWPDVRFVGVIGLFNKMGQDARRLLSVDEVDDDPTLLLDRFAITVKDVDAAAAAKDEKDAKDAQQKNGQQKDEKQTP